MEERNIRQILKRYLLGNAGEKDIKIVDNWYRSFDNIDQVPLSEETRNAVKQEIWDKVVPVLGIERKLWILPRLMKVAAMIVLIAGAAYGLFLLRNGMSGHSGTMAYTTISTGTGEKKKITIPDGSRLTLDAGTTIRFGDDFSKERKIELVDGEVFFDVQKDEQRPFIIQSQGLTTTVLGTSFNISAYKGLNNVSIGVVSGKVSVAGHAAASTVLEKDQELVYNKNTKSYKTIPLDESLTAWQEGRLLLNDLSFSEVAIIMKKNFGVELVANDDNIKNTRYTTELLANMPPAEAVEVLAAIHYLKTRQEGGKIFLYK